MANTTGKKFGGRKKGTPNVATTRVKSAIMEAFEELGGKEYLLTVAREDPKTYCTLLAKVLPAEIKTELSTIDQDGMPAGFHIEFVTKDTANTK